MVLDQQILQCRMCSCSCHAQQCVRELTFDTHQLLQFRNVHVLEIFDLHTAAFLSVDRKIPGGKPRASIAPSGFMDAKRGRGSSVPLILFRLGSLNEQDKPGFRALV